MEPYETIRGHIGHMGPYGPICPRMGQERFKTPPKRPQRPPKGHPRDPKGSPGERKEGHRAPNGAPKEPKGRPNEDQKAPQSRSGYPPGHREGTRPNECTKTPLFTMPCKVALAETPLIMRFQHAPETLFSRKVTKTSLLMRF